MSSESQAMSMSMSMSMSEIIEGRYEWDVSHRAVRIGEKHLLCDVLLLKVCRLRWVAAEADLSWTIDWFPVPRSSTILQSHAMSTKYFNIVLSLAGIHPTPGPMIDDIVSLALSIANIKATGVTADEDDGAVNCEFPVIEVRIWDEDDAEAKEEVVSTIVEYRDELPDMEDLFVRYVSETLEKLEEAMAFEEAEAERSDECSICLEEVTVEEEVARMPCCSHCILGRLLRINSCPLCKCFIL